MMIATVILEVFNVITPELVELVEPTTIMAFSWLLPLLGLASSGIGSIYSQYKSAEANEEAAREARELQRKQEEMYKKQQAEAEMLKYSEGDFMNTAMGKGLITEIQDQYKSAMKQGTANGLKRELTDEAKQANTQTANKQLTDSMRGVAQVGTNYRLNILNMVNQLKNGAYANKMAGDTNMANLKLGMLEGKNQSALNLGQNFTNIGSDIINTAGSVDWGDVNWGKKNKNKGQGNTSTGQSDADTGEANTKKTVWGTTDGEIPPSGVQKHTHEDFLKAVMEGENW